MPIYRGVMLRTDGGLYIYELEAETKERAVEHAMNLAHPTKDYALLGVLEQMIETDEIEPRLRKSVSGFFDNRG